MAPHVLRDNIQNTQPHKQGPSEICPDSSLQRSPVCPIGGLYSGHMELLLGGLPAVGHSGPHLCLPPPLSCHWSNSSCLARPCPVLILPQGSPWTMWSKGPPLLWVGTHPWSPNWGLCTASFCTDILLGQWTFLLQVTSFSSFIVSPACDALLHVPWHCRLWLNVGVRNYEPSCSFYSTSHTSFNGECLYHSDKINETEKPSAETRPPPTCNFLAWLEAGSAVKMLI